LDESRVATELLAELIEILPEQPSLAIVRITKEFAARDIDVAGRCGIVGKDGEQPHLARLQAYELTVDRQRALCQIDDAGRSRKPFYSGLLVYLPSTPGEEHRLLSRPQQKAVEFVAGRKWDRWRGEDDQGMSRRDADRCESLERDGRRIEQRHDQRLVPGMRFERALGRRGPNDAIEAMLTTGETPCIESRHAVRRRGTEQENHLHFPSKLVRIIHHLPASPQAAARKTAARSHLSNAHARSELPVFEPVNAAALVRG
jgi:hypothetical protein